MVLHGEGGDVHKLDALGRAVVEVDVREAHATVLLGHDDGRHVAAGPEAQVLVGGVLGHAVRELGHERAEGREDRPVVVVLSGDLHLAGEQVHHGLVAAVVAVRELLDLGAGRHGDDLVAEADAKDRELAEARAHGVDHGRNADRVSGAVGEEHAVGVHLEDLLGGRVPGHDGDLAAGGREALADALLLAAVVGHDVQARLAVGVLAGHDVGLARGDVGHVVVVGDGRRRLDAANKALGVEVGGGNGRPHGAALADGDGEGARVHVLDGNDAVLREEVREGLHGLPVARRVAHVVDHEAGQVERVALHVLLVDAVVADLGVRERDDLARVGRVAHDLLVADHRGVEHNLAEGLALGAGRAPKEVHPVLEREKRPRMPAVVNQ